MYVTRTYTGIHVNSARICFFNAHGIGDREEIESEGIVGGLY